MIEIQFAKIRENAIIPTKREEDAGYDIFACFDEPYILIEPATTVKIPTGIASAFTKDFCMVLKERGSTGSQGIGQRSGIIDSGYRNEWLVPITNHNNIPIIIANTGITDLELEEKFGKNFIKYSSQKAISQALLVPVPKSESVEVTYEQLLKNKSERMLDGFGSTNK